MKRKRVALLVESSRSNGRKILHGISHYVRARQSWLVYCHERSLHEGFPENLLGWKPDGVLARIENRRFANRIRKLNVPVIDLIGWYPMPNVPRFGNDHRKSAELAYDHFLEHNLSQFAYCGYPGLPASDERERHFRSVVKENGEKLHAFRGTITSGDLATRENHGLLESSEIMAWLDSLPKPIGLFACNDARAQQVITICNSAEIAVPEDISVLGVDNDELLCELCTPGLSSVELANEQLGLEAAALMDAMMNGTTVSTEYRLMTPIGVVQRHSTDTWAIDDPDTIKAMRFIRENACKGIQVEDICKHVHLSQSTLKRRFNEHLGRSPKSELTRIQIATAKSLLRTTSLTIQEIAEATGFDYI